MRKSIDFDRLLGLQFVLRERGVAQAQVGAHKARGARKEKEVRWHAQQEHVQCAVAAKERRIERVVRAELPQRAPRRAAVPLDHERQKKPTKGKSQQISLIKVFIGKAVRRKQ